MRDEMIKEDAQNKFACYKVSGGERERQLAIRGLLIKINSTLRAKKVAQSRFTICGCSGVK